MDNYCIREENKDNYFRGWDRSGNIKMAPGRKYAYRMSGTLSSNTLGKVELETGKRCEIIKAD